MSAIAKKLPNDLNLIVQEEEMNRKQYDYFAELMYQLSGVNLPFSSKNEALVKNRMSKLLRRSNIQGGFDALIKLLENPNQKLINDFVSALTTNKTHFFREEAHFTWLSQYLKSEHFKTHSDLRIWCAAASTGQEPYTLAMVMRENIDASHLPKVKFLATDIDLQVLNKASQGLYSEQEMDGCPDTLKIKYFEKIKGKEIKFRAKDDIAKMVRFAPFNLMQEKYVFQHKFHIIFCRNVLIYFDPPTVKKVVDSLASCLVPGGFLILGHSESGTSKSELVKPLSRAIFKKL